MQTPNYDGRVLVEDTDRLIEYILERDRNVLRELLTTNKAFVAHKTGADTKKKRLQEIAKFEEGKKKDPAKYKNKTLKLPGRSVYLAYNLTDFPDTQPVELPAEQRALDNTLIVYLSDGAESHHSRCWEWPMVLLGNVGNRLRTGRYFDYPGYGRQGHRTTANMYVTLLHLAGSNRDTFGMRDQGLRDLDQNGPLSELLA